MHLALTEERGGTIVDDREIWACAQTLLRIHGAGARAHAGARAAELAGAGDERGHHVFALIARRIGELELRAAPDRTH